MHSLLLLSGFLTLALNVGAVASSPSNPLLPQCATQCLATVLPTTVCEANDIACLCTDVHFLDAAASCIQANCTVKEALLAERVQVTTLCPQPIRDESATTQRVVWSLYGIATFSVIARMTSRLPVFGGSGYGWDDGTIFLGLGLLTPLNVICYILTQNGLGQDIWMLEPYEITNILYYFWIDEFLYTFVLNVTKISVLLLYIRMWPDAESLRFRKVCLILIGLLIVHAISMVIVLLVGCQPISYFWDVWDGEHEGHCIDLQAQIFASAGLNIAFDLLVFLIPLPKLAKLSFSSSRKKLALVLTFVAGLFVTVCSIIRLRYLAVWGSSPNLSWGYNPIAIWSCVECNAILLCACMPSLAGLVQRSWARSVGTPHTTYGRGSVITHEDDACVDYRLRLRSISFSGPPGRGKRRTSPDALTMNPVGARKTRVMSYGSDSSSGDPAPPALPLTAHLHSSDFYSFHATKPLPEVPESSIWE